MFSQQARLGMNACRMRGWSSSQARVLLLSWLDRLSVITQMVPSGLACSASWRKSWQQALLRDGAHMVTAWPSLTRSPP
jgi:hypothetical protein